MALTQARERWEEARRLYEHKCEETAVAETMFNGAIKDTLLEKAEAPEKHVKVCGECHGVSNDMSNDVALVVERHDVKSHDHCSIKPLLATRAFSLRTQTLSALRTQPVQPPLCRSQRHPNILGDLFDTHALSCCLLNGEKFLRRSHHFTRKMLANTLDVSQMWLCCTACAMSRCCACV